MNSINDFGNDVRQCQEAGMQYSPVSIRVSVAKQIATGSRPMRSTSCHSGVAIRNHILLFVQQRRRREEKKKKTQLLIIKEETNNNNNDNNNVINNCYHHYYYKYKHKIKNNKYV